MSEAASPIVLPLAPPTRGAIVAAARAWIGTPYRHQASLRGAGCDCLGLVRGLWREFYGAEPEPVPPYAADWAEASGREAMMAAGERHLVAVALVDRRPGDVVLFRWRADLPAKHAGILTDAGHIVHAYEGCAVVESPLGPWWRRHIAAAFAFPGIRDA